MKKMFAIGLLVILAITLIGCDKTHISKRETPYFIKDGEEIVYLKESHPDVVAIVEMIEEYAELWSDDYRDFDPHKSWGYYLPELRELLKERGIDQETIEMAREYEFISEYKGNLSVISLEFEPNMYKATIKYSFHGEIVNATPAYTERFGKEKGIYECTETFLLQKVNDVWGIRGWEPSEFKAISN